MDITCSGPLRGVPVSDSKGDLQELASEDRCGFTCRWITTNLSDDMVSMCFNLHRGVGRQFACGERETFPRKLEHSRGRGETDDGVGYGVLVGT